MLRFAANLSYLFIEDGFLQRFDAARAAGFAGVEFHFPYAFTPPQVAAAARAAGVEVVLFNLPAGDWNAGERGIACHPDRVAEFRAGVELAVEYAAALGCRRLNCLAGLRPGPVSKGQARETLIENLRFAAPLLGQAGIQLMLEPINSRDMPGFFINRSGEALALLDAVGSGNLRLQYDIYHAHVMADDLARTLADHLDRIGHIQIADNPGRREPGTGEIDFPFLFDHLDRLGYPGWIGCEYQPLTLARAGLGWLPGRLS